MTVSPSAGMAGPRGLAGDLLDRLRDDLVRHVGTPLDDDVALLLAGVTGAWDGPAAPGPHP